MNRGSPPRARKKALGGGELHVCCNWLAPLIESTHGGISLSSWSFVMSRVPLVRSLARRDQRVRRLGVERLEDRRLLSVTSFQDGVFPSTLYDGTRDVSIFASDADTNFGDEAILRADAEQSSSPGSSVWSLISFDLSDIPAAATVNSVSLSVNITNTTAEPGFHLFELKTPWVESQATWIGPSEGTTWEEPGATDPSDAGTTILGTLPGIATGPLEVSLNGDGVALVQSWIENAETNHGFILANADNDNSMRFDSREGTTAANRPRLTVDFQFDDGEAPTATIITPQDNGPEDENPASGEVRIGLRDGAFQIALDDFELDESTVTPAAVGVTLDGAAFTDFTYAYDAVADVITLAPTAAAYAAGRYEVTLSGGDSQIADSTGNVMPATVLVFEIDATLPTAPVAESDEYETDEDAPLVVNAAGGVLFNDFDGNTAATVVLVTGPEHGELSLSEDGSFTYTPEADFFGADGFDYLVSSERSDSQSARVEISVSPVDDAPLASDDEFVTGIDTTLTVRAPGVLVNDVDADGDTLSAVLLSEPTSGTLALAEDGSFEYTPNDGFEGVDSFQYKALAGGVETAAATVTIAVNPINDALVASDDTFNLTEDGVLVLDDSPFFSILEVSLATSGLVYDPVGGMVWVSVSSDNVVIPIDPFTGTIGEAIVVGSGPSPLAVSDDGTYLYVGLNGARSLKRVHLPTRTPDLEIPFGSLGVEDVEVMPGHPETVGVALRHYGRSPRTAGVRLYDNDVLRGSVGLGNNFDFNGDGTEAFGFLPELSSRLLSHAAITETGFAGLPNRSHYVSGTGALQWYNDRLYFESGNVLDDSTLLFVGQVNGGGARAHHSSGRDFWLRNGTNTIRVVDTETFIQFETVAAKSGFGDDTTRDLV
jgi:VCBS repeat-containing protein